MLTFPLICAPSKIPPATHSKMSRKKTDPVLLLSPGGILTVELANLGLLAGTFSCF